MKECVVAKSCKNHPSADHATHITEMLQRNQITIINTSGVELDVVEDSSIFRNSLLTPLRNLAENGATLYEKEVSDLGFLDRIHLASLVAAKCITKHLDLWDGSSEGGYRINLGMAL